MTTILIEGLVNGEWQKVIKLRYKDLKKLREGWQLHKSVKVEDMRIRVVS